MHLRWEETKEGDTVHGARLTIETGAGFPISISTPLGRERFFAETGIKLSDWYDKYWIRWGDALREAGLRPNQFTEAIAEDDLLSSLAILMRELGHFPLYGEIRLKARSDPGFPSHSTFARLGDKKGRAARLRAFLWYELTAQDVAAFRRRKFM